MSENTEECLSCGCQHFVQYRVFDDHTYRTEISCRNCGSLIFRPPGRSVPSDNDPASAEKRGQNEK